MAGDRIFMRTDLDVDPRVRFIAAQLNIADVHLVIGKLWALWAYADGHTEDGVIRFLTPAMIDQHVGCPGFSDQLVTVGWLKVKGNGVVIPKFTEYNGQSAKRRLRNAQRMHAVRSGAHTPRTKSAPKRTERARNDHGADTFEQPASATAKKNTSLIPGFPEFWAAYPRKVDKADAERTWAKLAPNDALREQIMAGLAALTPQYLRRIERGEREYVPHASTWLNKRRWEDEPEPTEAGHRPAAERPFVC